MDLFSSMENLAKEIGENGPASSNSAALMVNDGESKRRVSTCSGYSIFTGKLKKNWIFHRIFPFLISS